jgi:signal transduction histidine kinase
MPDAVLSAVPLCVDDLRVMRVLLVDDHTPIRRGLRQTLELRPEFEVIGEGANGEEAVQRVDELRPDVVLMDMNMPVMNGVEATRTIKERHPEVQVLALTAFGEMALVAAMVKAGAAGYLLKGGTSDELVEALEAVARGQGALDKEVTRGVMEDMAELYKKEQQRADALAELDRMKSEFVSVVSHELLTPLTSIKGGAATLRKSWESIETDIRGHLLDSMTRQCEKLQDLIEKILIVSGIQQGGLGLKPTIFDLSSLATEALALSGHGAEREVEVLSEAVRASGDRDRVRDVAHALIDNALNFTSGRVTIRVQGDHEWSRLSVSDEGPGIDRGTLLRLLDNPFVQGDSSHTRKVGGLGLSLYIARRVLEGSGGKLEVDTSPTTGSIFTIVLPAPERVPWVSGP